MSTAVATQRSNGVRVIGLLAIIAGVIMIVAGGVTWGAVSSQLASENITVPDDAAFVVGTKVDNPISALGGHHQQAHARRFGWSDLRRSSARRPELQRPLPRRRSPGQTQRTSVMNVPSCGPRCSRRSSPGAALVVGLGVLFVLVGWALRRLAAPVTGTATPDVAQE